VLEPL